MTKANLISLILNIINSISPRHAVRYWVEDMKKKPDTLFYRNTNMHFGIPYIISRVSFGFF